MFCLDVFCDLSNIVRVKDTVRELRQWLDCRAKQDFGIKIDKVSAVISVISKIERFVSAVFNRISDFGGSEYMIQSFATSCVCGNFDKIWVLKAHKINQMEFGGDARIFLLRSSPSLSLKSPNRMMP
jgi:hypothetical protein